MCGISGVEFVVIIAAAIIFLGPDRLPEMMRAAGRAVQELRRLKGNLGEVTREIREATGVDELRKDIAAELQLDRARERVTEAEHEIDAIRSRLRSRMSAEDLGNIARSPAKDDSSTESGSGAAPKTAAAASKSVVTRPILAVQDGPATVAPTVTRRVVSPGPHDIAAEPAATEPAATEPVRKRGIIRAGPDDEPYDDGPTPSVGTAPSGDVPAGDPAEEADA